MAASYRRQRVFKWTGEANLSDWVWSTIGDVDEYVAISHTWGSESNLTTKIIAGVLLQVSTWKHDNLEQWIQKNLSGIWIWMDILCIPQDDGEECISACLQSIPQVFNAAECVHVLLEDHTPLKLPTYEEFDEMHARNNMEYRATDPQTRRLPIMELFKQWADDNRAFLPKLAWLQRLWTRQEAQYSSKICFHGVATATGPSMGRNSSPKTDIQPFGPIGQLSSSLVGDRWDLMCKIIIELAAGRGTPVAGLGGIQRQRIGGLVMAFCELRAARRATKKSQDYVLALFPTFDCCIPGVGPAASQLRAALGSGAIPSMAVRNMVGSVEIMVAAKTVAAGKALIAGNMGVGKLALATKTGGVVKAGTVSKSLLLWYGAMGVGGVATMATGMVLVSGATALWIWRKKSVVGGLEAEERWLAHEGEPLLPGKEDPSVLTDFVRKTTVAASIW
ncbi:hypothetical protein KCU78_g3430, partial [Aureobasidium melanogenum]